MLPKIRTIGSFPTAPRSKITSGNFSFNRFLTASLTPQSIVFTPAAGSFSRSNDEISNPASLHASMISAEYFTLVALLFALSCFIIANIILATWSLTPNSTLPACIPSFVGTILPSTAATSYSLSASSTAIPMFVPTSGMSFPKSAVLFSILTASLTFSSTRYLSASFRNLYTWFTTTRLDNSSPPEIASCTNFFADRAASRNFFPFASSAVRAAENEHPAP